jgi:ubiquinone/menaquinone biosynthesis C-methylase UbiE
LAANSNSRRELRAHRGNYGTDGGIIGIVALVVVSAAGLLLAVLAVAHSRSGHVPSAVLELLLALVLLQVAPSYLYSTRRGKFLVWADLLDDLHLHGDERVLDMGCGRGAILAMVAKILPSGRAIGLDLWRSQDQSGNSPEVAWRNLEIEGVRDRCALLTGDMQAIPFPDHSFDLVVSNLAIHNIKGHAGRAQAVDEAIRVLKPGGRLLIADIGRTNEYARRLRERRMMNVLERSLGWRFRFGAVGIPCGLVAASRPRSAESS